MLGRAAVHGLPDPGDVARGASRLDRGRRVRSLAGAGENLPEDDDAGDLTLSHGLFTVMAGAAETRPTLLALDDLHWCDVASLEFVLYVLHRVDELPAAVVMTRRPGIGGESTDRCGRRPSQETGTYQYQTGTYRQRR